MYDTEFFYLASYLILLHKIQLCPVDIIYKLSSMKNDTLSYSKREHLKF